LKDGSDNDIITDVGRLSETRPVTTRTACDHRLLDHAVDEDLSPSTGMHNGPTLDVDLS